MTSIRPDRQVPVGVRAWGTASARPPGHTLVGSILRNSCADRGIRAFNVARIRGDRTKYHGSRHDRDGPLFGPPPRLSGAAVAWMVTNPGADVLMGGNIDAQTVVLGGGACTPDWRPPSWARTSVQLIPEPLSPDPELLSACGQRPANGRPAQAWKRIGVGPRPPLPRRRASACGQDLLGVPICDSPRIPITVMPPAGRSCRTASGGSKGSLLKQGRVGYSAGRW